jgi:hydroxyacylglutathione hydrolase
MTETVTQINLGQANVFLIQGQAGCVLVDTGNPDSTDVILEKLKEHGVAPDDVRLILITHGHTDHFGSAAVLRERTGAPVAVHTLDADAVRQGINQPDSFQPTGRLLTVLRRIPAVQRLLDSNRAPPCEPDVVFEGEETRLDEYGVAGRVIHTPGHTHGSVSVLLDSGEAIIGDAVMGKMMGLIRKPGHPFIAWDLAQNRDSVRRLLAHSPHTVYVGHGGPFAAEDVGRLAADERVLTLG